MAKSHNNDGFSLTEVLLAVGTLAIGMIFVAGVFPVAIHFTTVATERTIAAVIADEAFAKIRLYAVCDPNKSNDDIELSKLKEDELTDFNDVTDELQGGNSIEFTYPSTADIDIAQRRYCWSALARLVKGYSGISDPNRLVQVTVLVCRKNGGGLKYYGTDSVGRPDWSNLIDWPRPVKVQVDSGHRDNELAIDYSNPAEKGFINDGCTIIDDETGRLYRVLERYSSPDDDIILLDGDWDGDTNADVWVVPPPINGSRYPCMAIYQKVIRF